MTKRPIECSLCKKKTDVMYQEVVDNESTCLEMCSACPVLQRKLHGSSSHLHDSASTPLGCAQCMTTLESIRRGEPLGCSNCYFVFEDVLIDELIQQKLLPNHIQKELLRKTILPIHLGQMPTVTTHTPKTHQLCSLHNDLNEAIHKENYEKAAQLRDQIKKLSDPCHDQSL